MVSDQYGAALFHTVTVVVPSDEPRSKDGARRSKTRELPAKPRPTMYVHGPKSADWPYYLSSYHMPSGGPRDALCYFTRDASFYGFDAMDMPLSPSKVPPLEWLRYIMRLHTPPGGTVLVLGGSDGLGVSAAFIEGEWVYQWGEHATRCFTCDVVLCKGLSWMSGVTLPNEVNLLTPLRL